MNRLTALRRDDGSALLFAVIIVFVIMTVVTAMLSLGSGNLVANARLTDTRNMQYDAAGGIQVAVNTLRRSLYNNSSGQKCFPDSSGSLTSAGASDTLQLNNLVSQPTGGDSVTVVCTHSTGSSSPVLINTTNRPDYAVLTTGNLAGEPGLSVKPLASFPFRVHGVIYSNSTISVANGSVTDDNGVYAKGSCTLTAGGAITPTALCNYTGAAPDGATPPYAPDDGDIADYPLRTVPTCTKSTAAIVTFTPGYYDDATALNNIMTGGNACTGSTFWFRPGRYYFDFHNGDDPALPSGNHVWTVNTGYLVGGTPATPSRVPVLNPTVPGACVSPIMEQNDSVDQGVQFIFGGDSQLVVDDAKAEICGTYSASHPPIAFFGLNSGSGETSVAPAVWSATAKDATDSGAFANAYPGVRQPGDGSTATATIAKNVSASLTVSGYAPPSALPAGTHLDSATLTVVHGDSSGSKNDTLTSTITVAGQQVSVKVPAYSDNVLHTDTVDLLNAASYVAGSPTLASVVHANGYPAAGATVAYAASLNHAGTESVDALQLSFGYRVPAFRPESTPWLRVGSFPQAAPSTNCLTQPYPGSGACAALTSTQAPHNQLYLQGTAFAPQAVLNVSLNQATSQVFKFGVVARSLQLKVTGSSTFDQPIIEVPDSSPGSVVSTNVILTAYVCQASATCSASGVPALKARVAVIDPDPGAVVKGLRAAVIQSWIAPYRSN